MTSKPVKSSLCPICGGNLKPGLANVPFLFPTTVIVVKNVPAEVCANCHEPYMAGQATDRVMNLLASFHRLQAEVLILSYPDNATEMAIPV
jgi:YgiT-type zinc finger domain-containing protein